MKIIKGIAVLGIVFLCACAVKKMKALSECEFRLDKVNKVYVAGVDIDPTGQKKLSLVDAFGIAGALGQKKLPVILDLSIDGKNPNSIEAKMSKFDWKIKIKGNEILDGQVNNAVSLPPKSNDVFDFNAGFDLFPVVEKYSLDELKDLLNNAFDKDGNPKEIQLFIKPYLSVGKVNIPYPGYINLTKYYKSE